jgi:uncharacterized protein YndB with AHSA1/START domain
MVWKEWTDPKKVKKWWGPRGVTNQICEWDARPNGKINIVMLAGKDLGNFAGQRWPMTGTFRKVIPQSKIVYTSNALDDAGDVLIEGEVTIDFDDLGGDKTMMKLHIVVTKAGKNAEMALQGMEIGWNQQIDKLSDKLSNK